MVLKFTKALACTLAAIMFCGKLNGQLSGSYTIPGSYASIAAAISALNTQSISGAVVFNISAGYTETAPAGGFSVTASGTALTPITFQKSGAGANPLISAYNGGTGTPASAVQDGIWRFIGCDFITIDGIDLVDPNVANPSTMEYGYGFFKAGPLDGCQNNEIRNCTITLRVANNANGAGPSSDGSRGINVVNSLHTSQTTALTPVTPAGANSNNRFYNNVIKDCNIGIALIGYAAPSPFTLADTGNDIGGLSATTSNTIINFGGATGASNPAAGVRTLAQYDLNVSFNLINNNDGSGANHIAQLRGIHVNAATSANTTINNNTITINSAGTTAQVAAIENLSGATALSNTVSICNNLITSSSSTLNTTGSFYGIFNNAASASVLLINSNTLTGISTKASSGSVQLISNTGAIGAFININSNLFSECTHTATTSGSYNHVINNAVSNASITISLNTFSASTLFATSGSIYFVNNAGASNGGITIDNNTITASSSSISTTGFFMGIANTGTSSASLTMNNNVFTDHTVTAVSNAIHLLYNSGAITNAISFDNNFVSGNTYSFTGSGFYFGIYNNAASTGSLTFANNTFSNTLLSATSGSVMYIHNRGSATTTFANVTYANNLISGCTYSASSNAPCYGFLNNGVRVGDVNFINNSIVNCHWQTITAARFLIQNTGPVDNTISFTGNLLSGCTNTTNTTGVFYGINNTGTVGVSLSMSANTFSNVSGRATSGSTFYFFNSGQVPGGNITMTNNLISACDNSVTTNAEFYGIYNSGTMYSILAIANNTLQNNFIVSSTGSTNFIYNTGAVSTSITSVDMANNLLVGNTNSVTSSGTFFGIYNNSASCQSLSINSNTISNHTSSSVNGATHLLYNRGTASNTFALVSINANEISNCVHNCSSTGAIYTIWNNGVTSTVTNVSNNVILDNTWNTTTSLRYMIANSGVGVSSINLSNNLVSGNTHTLNTTGALFGIYNTAASADEVSLTNNTFSNNITVSTSGEANMISNTGATTGSVTLKNNMIAGISHTATTSGAFYGVYNNAASSPYLEISGNSLSNNTFSSNTGPIHYVYNRGSAANTFVTIFIKNNLVSNCTNTTVAGGALNAIQNNNVTATNVAITSNTLTNNTSICTAAPINLIYNSGPTSGSISLSDNFISNWTNTLTATGQFLCIANGGASAGGNLSITNNTISALSSSANTNAGNRMLIYNSGIVTGSISLSNNQISACNHIISGNASYYGVYNTFNSSAVSLNMDNNVFDNNFATVTSGSGYWIYNTSSSAANIISTVSISNNQVNNYTVTGNGPLYGIYNAGYSSQVLSITNNTLTNITSEGVTNAKYLVYNTGRPSGTLTVSDNLFSNVTASLNTTGTFYGVYNNGAFPSNINITDNRFTFFNLTSTSGSMQWIYNAGSSTNTITLGNFSNNLLSNVTMSISGSGTYYGIYNTGVTTKSLSAISNSFVNISINSTTSTRYMVGNAGAVNDLLEFSNNVVSGFTSTTSTSGSFYSFANTGAATGDISISNNSLLFNTLSATSGSVFAAYNAANVDGTLTFSNNLVNDLTFTASSSGGVLGIYNNNVSVGTLNIVSNTLSTINFTTLSGALHLFFNRGPTSTTISSLNMLNNTASVINYSSTNGPFYGIYNGSASTSTLNLNGNSINDVVVNSATGLKYLAYNTGASNKISISNNFFAGFTNSLNTTPSFYGVYNTGNSTGDIELKGNSVGNFTVNASNGNNFMLYNTGVASGNLSLNGNSISNCLSQASGTGGFYGVYNNSATAPNISISSNTLSNNTIDVSTPSTYLILNSGSAANANNITISANHINGIHHTSTNGTFYAVTNNSVNTTSLDMSANTFSNISSIGTDATRYLLFNTGSVAATANINNNIISGFTNSLNSLGVFYGIFNASGATNDLNMNGNSMTNSDLYSGTADRYLVYNTSIVSGNASISNNTLTGCSNPDQASGNFYGIYNSGGSYTHLSLSGNTFSNSSSVSSGATYLIRNTGNSNGSVTINANNLSHAFTNTSTNHSGQMFSILNSPTSTLSAVTISGNQFTGYNYTGLPGISDFFYISNTADNGIAIFSNNNWNSITLNHNGTHYLIDNLSTSSSSLTVSGNGISGAYTRSGMSGSTYLYRSGNNLGTARQIFSGNNFSNIVSNVQGSGSFFGIYSVDGAHSKEIYNNIISNVNYNGLGYFYGYYVDGLGSATSSLPSAIYNNTLSSINWAGPFSGIQAGGNISSVHAANIYSNTIGVVTCSTTISSSKAISLQSGGAGLRLYKNKIHDLVEINQTGNIEGVYVSGNGNVSIENNLIGNILAPATTSSNAINGINVNGGSLVNIYYNTVFLNAVSSGSTFGTNALNASSSVNVDVRNNIFINNSSPSGAGVTAVFRRNGTGLSNYLNSSNNNIFYAGVPASNRVIYHNGSTGYPLMANFQTHVAPGEASSQWENTNFISTVGNNPNFLHVDPTVFSLSESGASNIAGITDDYDAQIRQGNAGYAGTGTAPDIGADEFEQNLNPCSGATAGNVTLPLASSICEGETVFMMASGTSANGGIQHQWKTSTVSGGPYNNVTGGTGQNSTAYTTPTLSAGTYYFILATTCSVGPVIANSNEVMVTVNAIPSASASVLNSSLCAGQTLNLTANSDIGTGYMWVGPNNFSSTVQNPLIPNTITNSGGTYTLLVTTANCTSTPAMVNASVFPSPPAFSVTPQTASMCIGSSQTISASLPLNSPTLTFGSQAAMNPSNGYPAPYSVYFGGQKMQMLIHAAELASAGFTVGTPISSIQFPVVAKGANWGGSLNECQNFMVSIKATAVNALSVFETGLTTVVSPSNFTPAIGYGNVHSFSSPFIWDGVSNLVIETMFSNNIVGNAGNAVVQYNSPTGFQSTLVYRADNQNLAAIASATTGNASVGFVRPDFRLNGAQIGTYTWDPPLGLSATVGQSVVASPTVSTVYTATLSDGQCYSTSEMSLSVILIPTINIVSTSSAVCVGNSVTLTASGASTYTWSSGPTESVVTVSPFISTVYTVTGSNPTCPSATATTTVLTLPALTLNTTYTPSALCAGETATLTVSGATSYTWTGGENTTSITVSPAITTSYNVTGSNGPGCSGSTVVQVKVNQLPIVTITPSTPTLCVGEIIDIAASGANTFTWLPGNSNSQILSISPSVTTIYTVKGLDLNNCSNTGSVTIIVDPCTALEQHQEGTPQVSVFPNPSHGLVNIQFSTIEERRIIISSSTGALINELITKNQLEVVDLEKMDKGIYFVTVFSSQAVYTARLIIQ